MPTACVTPAVSRCAPPVDGRASNVNAVAAAIATATTVAHNLSIALPRQARQHEELAALILGGAQRTAVGALEARRVPAVRLDADEERARLAEDVRDVDQAGVLP